MLLKIKTFLYKIWLIIPYSFGSKSVKKYEKNGEKAVLRKLLDLAEWLFRDNFFNVNYYAWRLNIKGAKQSDYIGRKELLSIKNKNETRLKRRLGNEKLNYEIITKDKFYSGALFAANNLPVIPVLGIVSQKEVLYVSGKTEDISMLYNRTTPFVLKNTVMEAGGGFLLCKPDKEMLVVNDKAISPKEFKGLLGTGKWVLQPQIKSHREISRINSSALNTTRIVTVFDGERPVYLTGFQSFATSNCEIDSWSKGAVYVGIDPARNCLKPYGYFQPQVGNMAITEKHPDSGIVFRDYIIKDLSKAVELCVSAHKLLYASFIIGWDIAITNDGPLIVEANEKPGMNAVQCFDGGLREKIKTFVNKTINYV